MNSDKTDIKVIVPILNEAAELPALLASLAAQEDVEIELILCDGGSGDGSRQIVSELAATCRFPVRLIQSERGRGCQMNAGAAVAGSGLLLFLHADSSFEDCTALSKAVAFYHRQTASGPETFAARFSLQFLLSNPAPSLAYFYYEAKARLPRHDCIRGDQGFLLNCLTFTQAGRFDESLSMLEDIRLVEATSSHMKWQLLPAVIRSSARRFEREGLMERQLLNAIIVNSVATGWTEFFHELPGIYRCHTDSGRLLLTPLLEGIQRLIVGHEIAWQRLFWRATGSHIAGNAWQLFYWLDVRRAFRCGNGPEAVEPLWLDFYGRLLKPLFESRPAALLAELLTRIWLRWMLKSVKS
jgi:rSAM/selenodomain-associated transferase 2